MQSRIRQLCCHQPFRMTNRVRTSHISSWSALRRARSCVRIWQTRGWGATGPIPRPITARGRGPAGAGAHLFGVPTPAREELCAHLANAGVATDVHYPVPDYSQAAWTRGRSTPILERTHSACAEDVT